MSFDIARIAEHKIKEAMDEGVFDNLPGKGKPLDLDDDTPVHLRILKNAKVLPDWMQIHQDLDRAHGECARAWARIEKEYPRRRVKADSPPPIGSDPEKSRRDFAQWLSRTRAAYLRDLKQYNWDITKLNLMAPSIVRGRIPFRLEEEMERFDTTFPALPGVEVSAPTSEGTHEGGLRQAAEARYRYDSGKVRRS